MTDLQQAIESLYEVFARHPKPARIVSCPCGCTKPEETAPLLAAPLRELPSKDLTNYALSAMTTQGTLDDFRYLLPRLFQAIVEDLDGICPETLFGKLGYKKACWTKWPEPEVSAINGYLHAFWKTALNCYPTQEGIPTFFEIETALACIARTGVPLEPYLQIWTDTRTAAADENLIQFVTFHGSDFSEGKTLNKGFWSDSVPQGRELRRWLLSAGSIRRIADSAHLLREDGDEHLFGPALTVLCEEAAKQQEPTL